MQLETQEPNTPITALTAATSSIHEHLDSLGKSIEALSTRLEPLRRFTSGQEDNPEDDPLLHPSPPAPHSPIVLTLKIFTQRLRMYDEEIGKILDELEV